jgi:molybdopterin-guanine dinucleotide biosynthesis protein A
VSRATTPTFGAVILAGGRSSRMGSDKAWLPWRGKPLLAHVVDVVASVCNHPVVVVAAAGQRLPPLHPACIRVDDPPQFDHAGPLVGLFAGLGVLAAHHTELAYLGACDNVFLTADYLRLLFASLLDEPGLGGILPVDTPASGEATDRHFPHPLAGAVRTSPGAHGGPRDPRQGRLASAVRVRPGRRALARRRQPARPPGAADLQHAGRVRRGGGGGQRPVIASPP